MQTQLELAGDLGYLDPRLVQELMDQGWEVARIINGLVSTLGRGKSGEEKDSYAHSSDELRSLR
jgi:hypothetical protein